MKVELLVCWGSGQWTAFTVDIPHEKARQMAKEELIEFAKTAVRVGLPEEYERQVVHISLYQLHVSDGKG